MTHNTPNVINDAFRHYDDDVSGGIASQTALHAVDTNWTQAVDVKFHVAMLATETGGAEAASHNFRLEYNLNSGGWVDVTTTSAVKAVTADNCTTTDGSSYGTTALTTGATIQATEYDNNGSDSGAVVLAANASFEYTACLMLDSTLVAPSDSIQLRLSNAGTALDADTTIPTITASGLTDDRGTISTVGTNTAEVAASGGTQSITIPTSLEDDLVLAFISHDRGSADVSVPDGGTGWTTVRAEFGGTGNVGMGLFYKFQGATPATSFNLARASGGDSTDAQSVIVVVLRGVDLTNPIDRAPPSLEAATQSGEVTTIAPPASETHTDNARIFYMASLDDHVTTVSTWPSETSGGTQITNTAGADAAGITTAVAAYEQTTAGT